MVIYGQRERVQRLEAVEGDRDVVKVEERGCCGCAHVYSAACDTTRTSRSVTSGRRRLQSAPAAPMMPPGISSVTNTNRPPRAKSQYSGSAPVNQVLPAL